MDERNLCRQEKGIPDALNLLLTGDGKGAAEVLRKGGIKLLDDPVRNNSDDTLSNSWRFRFEDGREKDINVRAIARKFFPAHYLGIKERD